MSSKVEHNNEFSHTVTLGNKGAFDWSTQQERDTANGCRMLIMNATNFYNLLYLSENRDSPNQLSARSYLKTILKSSTHTWHYINLAGEYDFSDSIVPAIMFDLRAWIDFPIARPEFE